MQTIDDCPEPPRAASSPTPADAAARYAGDAASVAWGVGVGVGIAIGAGWARTLAGWVALISVIAIPPYVRRRAYSAARAAKIISPAPTPKSETAQKPQ